MGALGKHGDYWYPLQVREPCQLSDGNKAWTVQWWTFNKYITAAPLPDILPLEELEDPCLGSVKRRRQIRVRPFSVNPLHNYLGSLA